MIDAVQILTLLESANFTPVSIDFVGSSEQTDAQIKCLFSFVRAGNALLLVTPITVLK
jgi:hypothetical protein